MERWIGGGKLGTVGCTVPTAKLKEAVDLWAFRVESRILGRIDADVMG